MWAAGVKVRLGGAVRCGWALRHTQEGRGVDTALEQREHVGADPVQLGELRPEALNAVSVKAGIGVFIVDADASGVSRRGYRTQDGHRAAEVLFESVRVGADAVVGDPDDGFPLVERVVDEAIAALCAEAVGAMERMHELTVDYLKVRKQFGVPIGKFQAIQQYLATMAGETAASRVAAEMAADSYDTPSFALTVAAAKSRTGEAAETVGALAHQIHGAIGYTQEFALHHFTKRIWSWRDEFGTELDWTRELGRAALSAPRDTFWHFITDSTAQGTPT